VAVSWLTAAEIAARNAKILELFAMGFGRRAIAKAVDLTPQRVSQIVNALGYGWKDERSA
jgi:hypothetical protein